MVGLDVGDLTDDGCLRCMTGFFGELPTATPTCPAVRSISCSALTVYVSALHDLVITERDRYIAIPSAFSAIDRFVHRERCADL